MARNIEHHWFYPHAPEIVWDYLTQAELLGQWIMKNDFQPIVGHQFMFHAGAVPALDFDGNIYCEVLEIVPLKKLSYSWKCGSGRGETTLDSVVTWILVEKDKGTELQLVHRGFDGKGTDAYHLAMDKGWDDIGKKLVGIISVLQK